MAKKFRARVQYWQLVIKIITKLPVLNSRSRLRAEPCYAICSRRVFTTAVLRDPCVAVGQVSAGQDGDRGPAAGRGGHLARGHHHSHRAGGADAHTLPRRRLLLQPGRMRGLAVKVGCSHTGCRLRGWFWLRLGWITARATQTSTPSWSSLPHGT